MKLPPWRGGAQARSDTAVQRAMTAAMRRVATQEHQTLWTLATIWSRDCPRKLRRLQAVDWERVLAQARRTSSLSIPRL